MEKIKITAFIYIKNSAVKIDPATVQTTAVIGNVIRPLQIQWLFGSEKLGPGTSDFFKQNIVSSTSQNKNTPYV